MSILIQGMEMPKDDEILCININANGDVYYNLDLSVNTIAKAIHVPPHGRLIDADVLPTSTAVPLDGEPYQYVHINNIKNALTIVPEDKEG